VGLKRLYDDLSAGVEVSSAAAAQGRAETAMPPAKANIELKENNAF
jgi:hypothetical protein